MQELKTVKGQLLAYEKKMKHDRDLSHRQLQAIKMLDEKLVTMAKGKEYTLNALYDPAKRNSIYYQNNKGDYHENYEMETVNTLNLAFSSDQVLADLLDERAQEQNENKGTGNLDSKEIVNFNFE